MAHAANPREFLTCPGAKAHALSAAITTRPGVLRRLLRAFTQWRQREADREITRFLARSGGRFNDDFERELMHRVATRDWNVRR